MIVSVSAALLLAIVVTVLLRQRTVGIGSALACAAFGFCLASTGIAPAIEAFLTALVGLASLG
ncbi:hypothetical protein BU52_30705 [Streptomyces toyocaensis]|uniref:Uncharacterized protein n=1 Tax=Streptomyces toyocaensis TaxID=55952 RepID=A0A081XIN8_STRTO|nr:hypothetical protein [Streptomyces toyocaensis]KES03411.1 hypothetical protein BU52_30705 [Streptomyces toyocaensis]